jgi:glycosyltransferase involved in cell wall biosynthesis
MSKSKSKNLPFVSIITPTFNRRPFIPIIIQCFNNQDYPKNKLEWIIIDDGTDKIQDLVSHITQVKYFSFNEKIPLGKKRNIAHEKSCGEIIVYMDDDDYYPSNRVSHAVETLLNNPDALCAGSSQMFIYFKHIKSMYQFGPYGPNHATAATFAFHRRLLNQTSFEDNASIAEERHFLKSYTIPFVQLDPMKSILVFSHQHNSFDKKELLLNPNQFVKLSSKTVDDFVKEEDVKNFFMNKIDDLLVNYDPGNPKYKPDVLKQMNEMKIQREKMMIQKANEMNIASQKKICELQIMIQELMMENNLLKDKVTYFETKLKQIIQDKIQDKIQEAKSK